MDKFHTCVSLSPSHPQNGIKMPFLCSPPKMSILASLGGGGERCFCHRGSDRPELAQKGQALALELRDLGQVSSAVSAHFLT